MKNVSKIISCYAADTSGVCSALYELGGMVIVHDASGCNSTYSTHDEPRWYDKRSMIYISALKEMDSIMGNDEKLISDAVSAAHDQKPKFIAICGSPMPMMTGVDFDAIAEEIEHRSGIRTFAIHTNGTHSYLKGAADSLLEIAKEYVHEQPKIKNGVNILGATPLDFSVNGTVEAIKDKLEKNGFEVISCLAMNSTLDEIKNAASAKVNLVISYSGLSAAKYMEKQFGIPYICGLPFGKKFADEIIALLKSSDKSLYPCAERTADKKGIYIIGEGIISGSLAKAVELETGKKARVICPLDHDKNMLADGDFDFFAEEDIEKLLSEEKPKAVIADPLYKFIVPKQTEFISLPHFAFSGRCYQRYMPNLINETEFFEFIKNIL